MTPEVLHLVGALLGAIVPRIAAQWVLGARNTGPVWYLAQVVGAFALVLLVQPFRGMGAGVLCGLVANVSTVALMKDAAPHLWNWRARRRMGVQQ